MGATKALTFLIKVTGSKPPIMSMELACHNVSFGMLFPISSSIKTRSIMGRGKSQWLTGRKRDMEPID